MTIDIAYLKQWIGRTTEEEDLITPRLADAYRATLSGHLANVAGHEAPLALHWCLSTPSVAMEGLGPDGHPAKSTDENTFLPPVPLPRRMWAGGGIETLQPLKLGDRVVRRSEIADITVKEGRAGTLCFVTVRHEYSTERGIAIRDRQDIVYRDAPPPVPPSAAAKPSVAAAAPAKTSEAPIADLVQIAQPSPPLLFRYSALTFNSHRIHYDLPYAMNEEAYPGLVVHGPLQASLLFNLAATMGGSVPKSFQYRGLAPFICGNTMQLCGKKTEGAEDHATKCWTQTTDGKTSMEATATW